MSSTFFVGDLVLFGELVCMTDDTEEQMPERVAVIVGLAGPNYYKVAIVERFGVNINRAFTDEITVLAR